MTRVCVVVHHAYGSDPRVQRYVDALVAAGMIVDVLCLEDEAAVQVEGGARIFTVPLRHREGGLKRYLLEYGAAMVLFTIRLLALHFRHSYHVIQVHNIPDFLVFTALLPRLLGSKVILDNRDPMPEFFMSRFKKHPAGGRIVRLLAFQEQLASGFAHAVITANAAFKQNLVKRGTPAEKITVINNLPDPHIFNRRGYGRSQRDPGKPFTLIYPGTIAPRYGLELAVRALPLLKPQIPNLRLMIIGGQTDHASELIELARRLDVLSSVEVKPPVPVQEVPRHLAEADIGIYPALPDPHMSIATPTKVLEYAAMGLPIVASRLEVLEKLFDETSLLFFEPGDVEGFAGCILELYKSPDRRSALVRSADATFMRTHLWSIERQIYLELVGQLLRSSSLHKDARFPKST